MILKNTLLGTKLNPRTFIEDSYVILAQCLGEELGLQGPLKDQQG